MLRTTHLTKIAITECKLNLTHFLPTLGSHHLTSGLFFTPQLHLSPITANKCANKAQAVRRKLWSFRPPLPIQMRVIFSPEAGGEHERADYCNSFISLVCDFSGCFMWSVCFLKASFSQLRPSFLLQDYGLYRHGGVLSISWSPETVLLFSPFCWVNLCLRLSRKLQHTLLLQTALSVFVDVRTASWE